MKRSLVVCLWLLAAACEPARLKPPEFARSSQELKVLGYQQGKYAFLEDDLSIGGYRVTNIDHDWDNATNRKAAPLEHDVKTKSYRFDLEAPGRKLHGECKEEARKHAMAGSLKLKVELTCTCVEGGTTKVELALENRRGTAKIAGVAYQLSALRETQAGDRVSEALGYALRGAAGQGAVDVSGSGRVWLPASASEDERLGLMCSYASFLLYRPTTSWN